MPHSTAYILCTSPRSGSTLLCDLLFRSGVAGKPNSFFREKSFADWCGYWGIPHTTINTFDKAYIDVALTEGTQGQDCFGMRMMWSNMNPLQNRLANLFPNAENDPERLAAAIGPLRYIHLNRQDKVAEAVSYVIAEQSGLWHRYADGSERERAAPPREPNYDFNQIAEKVALLKAEAIGWDTWFVANNVEPHRITYEDLSADPVATLKDLLRFLARPIPSDAVSPKSARLADQRNAQWVARFRADTKDA